jgi:cytochrome c-type biogenesis protein CcmF
VKPFIRWIWLGAFMIALGGVIAVLDKRYRKTPGNVTRGNVTLPSGEQKSDPKPALAHAKKGN